jgi:NTP pyrophosphatase (non-canonical NTP hydrolase)
MITNKDLEAFEYYEMFPETEASSNPFKDYSEWVEDKILTEGHDRLVENTLGLVGEAGEVAEKIKKLIRDNNRYTSTDIIKELGDVVFYATALANYYGGDLGVTLAMNVKKLDDRELRGKLKGDGDNR